jgi:YidC/Oxa1 family membrane protein insertase
MEYVWFNLGQPDPTYILPILAGVLQFVLSLMMMGLTPAPAVVEPVGKKKAKKNALAVTPKKPEAQDTMSDFSASMQKQMVFVLPVMTTFSFILLKLPSGLALYWVVTSIYSIVQQYYISGPGALSDYWQKAQTFISSKTK